MQHGQPLITVHAVGFYPQRLEIGQDVRLDALQPGLGCPQVLRLNAKGDVLGLGQAVVALSQLILEHIRILLPDAVEGVLLVRDGDGPLPFLHIRPLVEEGELDLDGGIKVVEEITVILKYLVLILILCQLVVNIVELHLLGEIVVVHHTDAVPAHLLIRDGLLGGLREPSAALCLFNGGGQTALFRAGQLGVRHQPDGAFQLCLFLLELLFCGLQAFGLLCLLSVFQFLRPPLLIHSTAPGRRTGCLSDMA